MWLTMIVPLNLQETNMSKWIAASAALALILGAPLAVAEVGSSKLPISLSAVDKDGKPLPTYIVPKDADILRHDNAEQIMLGKRLLNETSVYYQKMSALI